MKSSDLNEWIGFMGTVYVRMSASAWMMDAFRRGGSVQLSMGFE